MTEFLKPIDLETFSADIIAHNAALTPKKLHQALRSKAAYIEVDLTVAEDTLVVAHEPGDYLALSHEKKSLQEPAHVFGKIAQAKKFPFLDLKDEVTKISQVSAIMDLIKDENTMASSNNHDVLLGLREHGFMGKIFFSVGSVHVLEEFLKVHKNKLYSRENFGISIKHTLLTEELSVHLKRMGLLIAAWNPHTQADIVTSILNGTDFVTSDNFELLGRIGGK